MITFQRITDSSSDYYNYMEQLMTISFPTDEYRDLEEERQFTDTHPLFCNNIILNDTTPVGFITYWDFGRFYYIEHFAIDPTQRNGGYGKTALNKLCETLQSPVVLEVETPKEEMAKRRIEFYKRQGFQLWEREYIQPPYKPSCSPIPMYLMVRGELDCAKDYDEIRSLIHQEVYHANL